MAESEIRTVHADELRFELGDERPRIDGRAAVYNSISEDLGGWFEILEPSALKLDEDLRVLFDHDTSRVIGRTKAGTAYAADDGQGIVMTAYPPDTQWARDLKASMERGDIDQMSFRMLVTDDSWELEDGRIVRRVRGADVSELSVVSMPAYTQTSAEARSKAEAMSGEGGSPEPQPEDEGGTPSDDGAKPTRHVYVPGVGLIPRPIKKGEAHDET